MENASQALFMAAGVLIAVMVISIGVYLFSSASTIAESYDTTMSATEIQKFNSKFEKYNKIRKQNADGTYYDYNTISDVVSAINLAYSINAKNNYDIQSSIEVSITGDWKYGRIGITPSVQELFFQKGIDEDNSVKDDANKCYSLEDSPKAEYTYMPTLLIDLNELLNNYNESKLDENHERIYKYAFDGETILNPETGLIDRIEFELLSTNYE